MSGTAYGTVVLHTSPEAAAGGPLAVVRDGDMIELDVPNRRLHLDISDAELAARLAAWTPPPDRRPSGYAWLLPRSMCRARIPAPTSTSSRAAGARRRARTATDAKLGRSSASARSRGTSMCPALRLRPDWELAATVSRRGTVEGVPTFTDFDAMLAAHPDVEAVASACRPFRALPAARRCCARAGT